MITPEQDPISLHTSDTEKDLHRKWDAEVSIKQEPRRLSIIQAM